MKKLKVNLVAVIALVIGVTTMSFQLTNLENVSQIGWYDVDPNGSLSPTPSGPPNESDCFTAIETNLCKIFWPEESSPPADVQDVLDQHPNTEKAGRVN